MKIQNAGYTKKRSKKGLVTVGIAVAVVAALGAAAYAAFSGGLEGLSFGKSSWSPSIEEDIKYSLPEREMISVQGYADSPEYQAAAEWMVFFDNYDRDGKILDAYDAECKRTHVDPFAEYNCYLVWSQEMVDKIDEITSKYNLEIHRNQVDCREDVFKEKFGDVFSGEFECGGYSYDDGSFELDALLNGINFQIGRCMRGYFDAGYINIGNKANYEEYEYKTKSGITVTIASGKDSHGLDKWIVTANLEKSFVTLNIMPYDYDLNEKEYSREDIQDLVDHIDFSKL